MSKKKWTDEELRETYKMLIHQMVDAVDDVERDLHIYQNINRITNKKDKGLRIALVLSFFYRFFTVLIKSFSIF